MLFHRIKQRKAAHQIGVVIRTGIAMGFLDQSFSGEMQHALYRPVTKSAIQVGGAAHVTFDAFITTNEGAMSRRKIVED